MYPGADKSLAISHCCRRDWLDGQPSECFLSGLQKLEQRAKKCIELRGAYVE